MFRLGIISEIGEGENLGYARVSFDENEIVSGWLAMPSMATYKTKHWVPVEVNAQVVCTMDENCEQCWSFGATRTPRPIGPAPIPWA